MGFRWSAIITVAAMLLLVIVAICPSAWSVDLSVRDNAYMMTPVSQIASDHLSGPSPTSEASTHPSDMGVDAIRSMEYHPSGSTPQSEPVNTQVIIPQSTAMTQQKMADSIPTFLVFPVISKDAQSKAFSDLPILLSTAVANRLEQKSNQERLGYQVINPIYAYDQIKEKGLEPFYEKLVSDYLQAGAPNPSDLTYLADELSTKGHHIDWVVFVEANFDASHITKPVGLEVPIAFILDSPPNGGSYFLQGKVQVFSTEDNTPLVWKNASTASMKLNQFDNFTPSVFDDSDSIMHFKTATNQMAVKMFSDLPPNAFTSHALVQAQLLQDPDVSSGTIGPDIQKALKRILSY